MSKLTEASACFCRNNRLRTVSEATGRSRNSVVATCSGVAGTPLRRSDPGPALRVASDQSNLPPHFFDGWLLGVEWPVFPPNELLRLRLGNSSTIADFPVLMYRERLVMGVSRKSSFGIDAGDRMPASRTASMNLSGVGIPPSTKAVLFFLNT